MPQPWGALKMNKEMKIRVPVRIKPGDTIGIVAPAGPFDRQTFFRGARIIEDMGFKIFIPPGLFEKNHYLAGSDKHRVQFVNQLFADKSIDAIICARGGYGSMRILPLLDLDTIKNNPKVFIGFSDITILLSVLFTHCNLVTFHGPVVTSLADASEETKLSLFSNVTADSNLEIKLSGGRTIKPGVAAGEVCGGNLTMLCHLVGTPFAPDLKNKILFLEDRGEAPYRIDRMLVHMELAGCFKGLSGIILGAFEECGPIEDIIKIIGELFEKYPVPILAGLDAGHGRHNLTIPLGIEATLDADRHSLIYHRAATTEDRGQRAENR
jgi:muramoyltetrapeptide carboxypeptidase